MTNRNIHEFTLVHCFYSAAHVAGAIGCNDWRLICIKVGAVVCLSGISTASVLLPCGTGWMALADCKEECHPCNWPSATHESIPKSKLNCCSSETNFRNWNVARFLSRCLLTPVYNTLLCKTAVCTKPQHDIIDWTHERHWRTRGRLGGSNPPPPLTGLSRWHVLD